MTPAAILFDLDDTLTDRAAALRRNADKLYQDMHPILHARTPYDLHLALYEADDYGSPQQAATLATAALWQTRPDAQGLVRHWNKNFGQSAVLFAGAVELLDKLRGENVKLGVVTNGEAKMQKAKIKALGIGHLLETITISSEAGFQKPDPEIFALAVTRVNCLAADVWFVGDNPDTDVRGAEEAGLRAFWVKTGGNRDRSNVGGVHLSSLTELLDYL